MDQVPIEEKRSFLHNDRLLVCSMFVLYGICIFGLVAAATWALNRRSQTMTANATSTGFAFATQQAKATAAGVTQRAMKTATASARTTEQAQYQLVDRFDNNKEDWWVKIVNDENMQGSVKIIAGVLRWDIQKVEQPFVDSISFHYMDNMERFDDFDVYVDTQIIDKRSGDGCSGFVFRKDTIDWEQGAYIFSVCSDSTFNVYYYKKGEWESIVRHESRSAIQDTGWNRLEINARGNDFTFLVNHEVIYKMTDDREPRGGLSLYVEVNEERPLTISFDNFGLQSR